MLILSPKNRTYGGLKAADTDGRKPARSVIPILAGGRMERTGKG